MGPDEDWYLQGGSCQGMTTLETRLMCLYHSLVDIIYLSHRLSMLTMSVKKSRSSSYLELIYKL